MGAERGGLARSFRAVLGNPDLRRVALAFVGFAVADKGVFIALLLVAYEAGAAAAAGLVGLTQFVPAATPAPFAALLVDRYRRERVLVAGYLAQAGCLAATTAALAVDASILGVYGLAALAAVASTVARPAQTALLPDLARTPEELTTATVAIGAIESLGSFAGPAAAGLLLAVSGATGVFAGMTALALGAARLASRVSARPARAPAVRRASSRTCGPGSGRPCASPGPAPSSPSSSPSPSRAAPSTSCPWWSRSSSSTPIAAGRRS